MLNTPTKRAVYGLLLLDKPAGISSNTALQTVKRLFRAQKAGHTGSLDPLASGMLPICFGEATKFSEFLLAADKVYKVTAKLGIQTTTGDREGEVVNTHTPPPLNTDLINGVFASFTGKQTQIPSMYSALKYKGQPLYKLARQGIEVERPQRSIEIHYITLIEYTQDTVTFEVKSSKGTYIRTLVEDIGHALGCGAHVDALRRLHAADFREDQMHTLSSLEILWENPTQLDKHLLPIETGITTLPELSISEAAYYYLRTGQPIIFPYETPPVDTQVKLMRQGGRFLGIGKVLMDGRVAPVRMVQT